MRRLSAALAATAAGLLLAAPAGAATNHALRATIRSNTVAGSGNNFVLAGVVNSAALGEGGTVARLHVVGTRSTVRFTIWYGRGSFHGTATYRLTPRPGGGVNFTGTGRVTGGTGRFAGATGSFTITGSQLASGRSTQVARGNLRY
jgi:hypothetical protein